MALILFDYDGVLADTLEELLRAGQVACDRLGVEHRVTKDDLNNLELMSFAAFGRACEVPEHRVGEFVEICLSDIAERESPPPVFPGLGEVVRKLSVDHAIEVVTTNSSRNVKAFLARHGLDRLVHAVYGVDTPGSKAQKISMARDRFLDRGGRGPVYMVGDSLSDVLAAKEASVVSIAVSWGHQPVERILRGGPDHVADFPDRLIEIIGR